MSTRMKRLLAEGRREQQTEAADPLFKAIHTKASDLLKMVEKIKKDAVEGKYAALDNWARKTDQLEAKCRLLSKALKKAEGKTPSGKK
jgi:hypothetical protein